MFPTQISDIDTAKYICSIGCMKACDDLQIIHYIDPFTIQVDWSKMLTHTYHQQPPCIYVKMGKINEFIQVFDRIPYPFILITGDGDETFPDDIIPFNLFKNIIENNKIIRWYSTNCDETIHPKLSAIPIGVNFHCDAIWKNIPVHSQEALLDKIRSESKPFYEREHKCYATFHFSTYDNFGNPRKRAIEEISKDVVYYEPNRTTPEETFINQTKYSFVLSPHGHGLDCHRTWEALILGCIVVVKKSILDPLYESLPVLIVDEWSDITQELLDNTIARFKTMEFNYDKITLQYWYNKTHSGNP